MLHSATPWTATCQAPLSFTIFQSLLKFVSTESVMVSNHLILCPHLLRVPSIFPGIRSFPARQLFESDGFIALYTTPYPQKPLSLLHLHPTDHAHFNPPHWVRFHPHHSNSASTKVLSHLHCTEDHDQSSILSELSLLEAATSEIIYSTLKYFLL